MPQLAPIVGCEVGSGVVIGVSIPEEHRDRADAVFTEGADRAHVEPVLHVIHGTP